MQDSIEDLEEEILHNQNLIRENVKALRILEVQAAQFALHIPVHIQIQIDSIKKTIETYKTNIEELGHRLSQERERLAELERERLVELERERLAKLERERLAQEKREGLAQEERERLAQEERERLAKLERTKQERERLAKQERERLALEKHDYLMNLDYEQYLREENERLSKKERERLEHERVIKLEREHLAEQEREHSRDHSLFNNDTISQNNVKVMSNTESYNLSSNKPKVQVKRYRLQRKWGWLVVVIIIFSLFMYKELNWLWPSMSPDNAQVITPTVSVISNNSQPTIPIKPVKKIALVTYAGGTITDGKYNQLAYEGLKRAEIELGVEIAYIESRSQWDYEKNIDFFVTEKYDLIICTDYVMSNALKKSAYKHPNQKFAIINYSYDPVIPNVKGIVASSDQGAYMVGALAAMMSKSGKIGVVAGMEIAPYQLMVMGYEAGAKSINPDIEVLQVYLATFTDPEIGAETANALVTEGADVILGVGDSTGNGAIEWASKAGIYVIGSDYDEYNTTFKNKSADKLLSSIVFQVDNSVFDIIKEVIDNEFKGGIYVATAANNGVGYAPFHDTEKDIPIIVKNKLDDIKRRLADGSIKTNIPKTLGYGEGW